MLELKSITKDYAVDKMTTTALKGISLEFRKSEFVAILGPSGCGKTTLLNIIGGLDRYTSGDLVIDNKSTKQFKDRDWDEYRNHKIGFVFQTYNLIQHQRIGANVELALTIAGLEKEERHHRVENALEQVGLLDHMRKRPNQLSGGQMQRVAIARALVTNPEIILADEPTGALDSESSIQVMDILKRASQDCLVVMVTHNPDLANKYATRIIEMKDGDIVADSNPLSEEELLFTRQDFEQREIERKQAESDAKEKGVKVKRVKRPSMSWKSAFALSMANLYTKKMRTMLTTFASSIGIIGVSLVLAMSAGASGFVSKVQEDSLSEYPMTVAKSSLDLSAVLELLTGGESGEVVAEDEVRAKATLSKFLAKFDPDSQNDLASIKTYLDENWNDEDGFIKYNYGTKVNLFSDYREDENGKLYHGYKADGTGNSYAIINPFKDSVEPMLKSVGGLVGDDMMKNINSFVDAMSIWGELVDNKKLLDSQYDILAGRWPDDDDYQVADKGSETNPFEVVLKVSEDNTIIDYELFALGLKPGTEALAVIASDEIDTVYTMSDLLGVTYKMMPTCDYFEKTADGQYNNLFVNNYNPLTGADATLNAKIDDAYNVKVVGVVRQKAGVTGGAITSTISYTSKLAQFVNANFLQSELYDAQMNGLTVTDKNVDENGEITTEDTGKTAKFVSGTTGISYAEFASDDYTKVTSVATVSDMKWEEFAKTYLEPYGYADTNTPKVIYLYAASFEAKQRIIGLLDRYQEETGENASYSDTLELIMKTVTQIINAVTYVLIGFAAVSLIVSSIMISIITYTSVVERTREIGVLRSLGASKHDIATIFNSETLMEGFLSGLVGVFIAWIISLPLNAWLLKAYNIVNIVDIVWWQVLCMIGLSVLLSWIAGIIPSQIAAKRDPVVALRSE